VEESILVSIKDMLGPDSSDDVFDSEILIHINMALSVLTQLGVGPSEGFVVTDADATWNQFLGNAKDIEMAKSFVFMKVKMVFDPPTSSFTLSAMEKACDELGWRLSVATDTTASSN